MTTNSNITLQPFIPIGNQEKISSVGNNPVAQSSANFADILKKSTQQVSFSHHALNRMKERSINLNPADMRKMNDTVQKMAQKGSKEALIYLNGAAFVVSVNNKTVITAMDGISTKENIFTNIDSAAIL